MTDRLLLQNFLAYSKPDEKRDFGNIICANDTDFLRLTEKCFYHNETLEKIKEAFKNGSKAVLLTGFSGTGKSYILRRFAWENRKKNRAVIFTEFDKDRHIFPDDSTVPGDSFFLKKCITRIFTEQLFYTKEFCTSYFYRESAEDLLFKLSGKNSYIIIDGVNTEQVPKYVDTLVEKGFKVLISSNTFPHCDCCNITEIKHLPADLSFSLGEGNEELYSVLGGNPSALHFAECFMKEFGFSAHQMTSWINNVSQDFDTNHIALFYHLAGFTPIEKEVFLTLGILLFYNGTGTRVYKSKTEIYTDELRNIFTGNLQSKVLRLIKLGFVSRLPDDSLYMEHAVLKFIVDVLKPCADDCPGLLKRLSEYSDFILLQDRKDLYGIISSPDEKCAMLTISENLLDIYGYFAPTDNKRIRRVYNLLMSYSLSNLGVSASERYTKHLIWRNKGYFVKLFCDVLSSDMASVIYKKQSGGHDYTSYYSNEINALLDIIRVCICLIRFSTSEHLEDYRYIYETLKDVFDKILAFSASKEHENQYKAEVLCDVIRLCEESFFYFNDILRDGSYNNERCSKNSVTGYFYSDSSRHFNCNSINILQDICTLKLYTSFRNISLHAYSIFENVSDCEVLEYFHTSRVNAELFIKDIAIFFNRLVNGFDSFYDFFSYKYTHTNISKVISGMTDKKLNELLVKARYFIEHGFDGDNGKDSKAYSYSIVTTIRKSYKPSPLLLLVTGSNFPVSAKCREHLRRIDFITAASKNPNIKSNLLSKLYLSAAENLASGTLYTSFYEYILDKTFLLTKIDANTFTEASHHLCYYFIKTVCSRIEKYIEPKYYDANIDELQQCIQQCKDNSAVIKHIQNLSDFVSAEHHIFHIIDDFCVNKNVKTKGKNALKEAFLSIIYGRLHRDTNISREGFLVLIDLLNTKNNSVHLLNEMIKFDLLHIISPQKHELMNNYISRNIKREVNL